MLGKHMSVRRIQGILLVYLHEICFNIVYLLRAFCI